MILRGLDLFFERRGYPYKVDNIPHMINLIKTFRIPEVINSCSENDHENQSQSEGESEDESQSQSQSDSDNEMVTEDKEGIKLKRSEERLMYEEVANVIGYFHQDAVMAYSSEPLDGYEDKGQGNDKTEGKGKPLPTISVCIHLSGKRETSNDLLSKFFYGESDLLTPYATATTCLKKEKNPFVDVTIYPLFEAMNKLVSVVIIYDRIESERGGGGGHAAAANSIISGGYGQEKEQDDQDEEEEEEEEEDQEDEDEDEDEDQNLEDMEEDLEEDLEEEEEEEDNEATGATHASSTSYRYRLTPIVIKKLGQMGIETMFSDRFFFTDDFLKFMGIKSVEPYVLPPDLAWKKSLRHCYFKKMVRKSDALAIYLNLKRDMLVCVIPLFDEDDQISFNTPEIYHIV